MTQTVRFFSFLCRILRDIPCLPIDLIRDPSRDSVRINFFPNLDYRTLYYALAQMLDSFASIQSTLAASAPGMRPSCGVYYLCKHNFVLLTQLCSITYFMQSSAWFPFWSTNSWTACR